nr:hypothetical protein [Candidatus Methanoperedens sp. BLZ2]
MSEPIRSKQPKFPNLNRKLENIRIHIHPHQHSGSKRTLPNKSHPTKKEHLLGIKEPLVKLQNLMRSSISKQIFVRVVIAMIWK